MPIQKEAWFAPELVWADLEKKIPKPCHHLNSGMVQLPANLYTGFIFELCG